MKIPIDCPKCRKEAEIIAADPEPGGPIGCVCVHCESSHISSYNERWDEILFISLSNEERQDLKSMHNINVKDLVCDTMEREMIKMINKC